LPGPAKSYIEQDIRIAGKTPASGAPSLQQRALKICRDLSEILEYDEKLGITLAISLLSFATFMCCSGKNHLPGIM
jgi:hypothetical protein